MSRKKKKNRQNSKTNRTKKTSLWVVISAIILVIGGIAALFQIFGISMKDILYPKQPINAIQQDTMINNEGNLIIYGDSVSITKSPTNNNTGDNPTFNINYNENE